MTTDYSLEIEEFYEDDHHFKSNKSSPKRKNLSTGDKKQSKDSYILMKVQLLPIPKSTKTSLTKLIINHTINDISKVLKTSKLAVTLEGKVVIKGDVKEAIIKVYSETACLRNQLYAFSRNINNESTEKAPQPIETDPKFLKEGLVLDTHENVVFIKKIRDFKTLEQMIKSYPEKKNQFFKELLQLFIDLKKRYNHLWRFRGCNLSNIIFHNEKWIFLSNFCTIYCLQCFNYEKSVEQKMLTDMIELFRSNGLTDKIIKMELKRLKKELKSCILVYSKRDNLMEKYFLMD